MKTGINYCLCILIVTSLTSCTKKVDGEVFIVTNGGNNVKLGLVNVSFLTQEQLSKTLDSNSVQYKDALDKYYTQDSIKEYESNTQFGFSYLDIAKRYTVLGRSTGNSKYFIEAQNNIKTAENYAALRRHYTRYPVDKFSLLGELVNLQNPISCMSNADGKFTAELKNQSYRVYACGSRSVGDKTEKYVWSFDYTPDGKLLILSNNNMKKN